MPSFIFLLRLATFASVREQEREHGLPRDVLEENNLLRVKTSVKSLPQKVKPGLEGSGMCASCVLPRRSAQPLPTPHPHLIVSGVIQQCCSEILRTEKSKHTLHLFILARAQKIKPPGGWTSFIISFYRQRNGLKS